jgi:hypothetical protein
MKEELRQAAAWARPMLVKVGTIRDVANNPGGLNQPPSNNRS